MKLKRLLFLLPSIVLFIVIFNYETIEEKENVKIVKPILDDNTYNDEESLVEGDTFSILAVDTTTGEVGGAGTSCVGFKIDFLSDLIVDEAGNILGGIHAQAAAESQNAVNARARMIAGDSPDEIITWLNNNDCCASSGGSAARQYGIVDFGGPNGTPRTAGFTGGTNSSYAGHIAGINYAIQGNILLDSDVLVDMETAFVNASGTLADKLMASLKAAKRVGGDNRCISRGNSGRASFIKVLRPNENVPYIDISLGPVENGVEPIDELECAFNSQTSPAVCLESITTFPYTMNFENFVWKKEDESCGSENTNASWIRSQFSTPSSSTGPVSANEGLLYAFVEASDLTANGVNNFSRRAVMGSPCFYIPENHSATLTFDYHMNGAEMGTLSLTAQTSSGTETIWTKNGNQGNLWYNDEVVDLSAYAGVAMKLRFDATTGNNFRSDMAIDDIKLSVQDIPTSFIFDNNTWSPNDPSLASNPSGDIDNIQILTGEPALSGNVTIGDMFIASGATFNQGSHTLNVSGDINNQGSMNTGNGTINITGFENQRISGEALSIEKLHLNQTGVLSLDAHVFITGTMQLNSGVLQTNGNLTFPDTYNASTGFHATGLLDEVTGGSIVGDVNIERYFPANRAYRLISTSVTTTSTIRENWQENGNNSAGFGTHITGNGGATNGFDATATNNPSLFTLNSTTQSYQVVSNTNVNTLIAGEAYLMFFRGDRTVDLTTNTPTPTATLLRTSGELFTGDYTVPSMSIVEGGSTLIGNPYQAPVDMALALSNSNNINTRYYHVYDQNIGERGAFVTVDTQENTNNLTYGNNETLSQANKYLQPHQGAFVNTLSDGVASLQFQESQKDLSGSGTDVFLSGNNNTETYIGVTLFDHEQNTVVDGTKIVFSTEDSNILDINDARKSFNLKANLCTLIDDVNLSIQRRSLPIDTDVIPLNVLNLETGDYSFNIHAENFSEDVITYIIDDYLNNVFTLASNTATTVNFSVNEGVQSSFGANRFKIVFKDEVLDVNGNELTNNLLLSPNPATTRVTINNTSNRSIARIEAFDFSGKRILNLNPTSTISSMQLNVEHWSTGIYMISVTLDNGVITMKRLIISD